VEKKRIRERVWKLLEERGVARFPKPVYGRIPNFEGAEAAAELLRRSEEYLHAEVVKVNPDAPQRAVRRAVLTDGRVLVMPTPRIVKGFLVLDPSRIPQRAYVEASTIKGAFNYGVPTHPRNLPDIDLIVAGSVAVTPDGWRVGKGEGFSELEYAILKSYGKCNDLTPVVTTVHDLQLVEKIPAEPYDLPVNKIYTNTRVIKCPPQPRPHGIIWGLLEEEKVASIPLLRELRSMSSQSRS
jgi:5-formyltetrahydrofolate cyclo-ligase